MWVISDMFHYSEDAETKAMVKMQDHIVLSCVVNSKGHGDYKRPQLVKLKP